MNTHTQEYRDYRFVIGLLTGTFVGAGLAMWLAPPVASERRRPVTDAARGSTRIVEAVDDLDRNGQNVHDEVAGAVARSAHAVERHATAARTDSVADTRKNSAADRSAPTPRSL
jgi:gas vesicle protein